MTNKNKNIPTAPKNEGAAGKGSEGSGDTTTTNNPGAEDGGDTTTTNNPGAKGGGDTTTTNNTGAKGGGDTIKTKEAKTEKLVKTDPKKMEIIKNIASTHGVDKVFENTKGEFFTNHSYALHSEAGKKENVTSHKV